ncbi:MAG: hypothetical protein BWY72_01999 [Bacteroidetes bacterium ADurb.Bin416]|nr:MAG: hypothetical protein BWY72_01999 [Bacteroidetes bacterium ADurb.Bin416]
MLSLELHHLSQLHFHPGFGFHDGLSHFSRIEHQNGIAFFYLTTVFDKLSNLERSVAIGNIGGRDVNGLNGFHVTAFIHIQVQGALGYFTNGHFLRLLFGASCDEQKGQHG